MVVLTGYQVLEQIYCGSRTLVYRGKRESDQKKVVIKLLRREYPSFNELMQFRNQYTIAKNLDFEGIVQSYCLDNYRNSYALVMEDFGGICLKEYFHNFCNNNYLYEFLNVAIQITTALEYLHRHRVIHKDIKPANILINPTTKQVKLIDFSIASLLPRETQALINPNILEGTLGYLSPEQTGRMNRGIDYRSDFYSLGVTFFEILTGQLPFVSEDPMELVYCHIAKLSPPAHTINPDIPPILSDIISKLMAKNAEERYSSAVGLKHDLEKCLHQYQETGKINQFKLGMRDLCDSFQIPEKLYGRQKEVETLLAAFERVAKSQSQMELLLVAGFSGIGKTAVVNEVHKPIVRERGYFLTGKYDQFQRNIPFSAFVLAFRDLMGQLLSEGDGQIQEWKNKILAVLGGQAQVIIDVIPELEQIIGQQPFVPELSGTAAQNRFNILFQNFIQVFGSADHPLVVFLDDLQWADSASLKLMQLLMCESDVSNLLLIGAYRDAEVSISHPLILTLEDIYQANANVIVNTINLQPLTQTDLNHLIADSLNCSQDNALPLTQLVYQKTQGNPFFSNQFLKALYEDKLITFNSDIGYWQCDITKVKELALTDDIVEFMALQLQKLPESSQNILKLAACIGNQFDLNTLATVYEQSLVQTATDLWKALKEGLLIPTSEIYKFFQDDSYNAQILENGQIPVYKFLHDRVQQAAYFLIPDNQKQATHYRIGKLLLSNIPEVETENNIFVIVNQLNYGIGLISQAAELSQLAQLNLIAGRKAKISTAYGAAIKYFTIAIDILTRDGWQNNYNLSLPLHLEMIEAKSLNAEFAEAAQLAETTLQNCQNLLDTIAVYQLQIQYLTAQNQMAKALETGLEAIALMGYTLVDVPNEGDSLPSLPELHTLDALPVMTDPHPIAAMRILMSVIAAAFTVSPGTWTQVILTMVKLCHEYGYSAYAASAYSQYGLVLSAVRGDIKSGYHSGQVALKILDLFESSALKCKTYLLVYGFIRPWQDAFSINLAPLLDGLQSGLDVGDVEFAGYCSFHYCDKAFAAGEILETIASKQVWFIELMQKYKQEFSLSYDKVWHQLVLNLQGLAEDKTQLVGDSFNEVELLPYFHSTNNGTLLFATYVAKVIISFLFGDYQGAITSASLATNYAASGAGMLTSVYHNFYYSLALLAQYTHVDQQQQSDYLKLITSHQEQLKQWSDNAPQNFLNKYYLVEAEKQRILGDFLTAMDTYDHSISLAHANYYLNEEALANELAGKFYLERNKEKIAQAYLLDAYYCYSRWGAKAKVEELESVYDELISHFLRMESRNSTLIESLSRTTNATLSTTTTNKTIAQTSSNTSLILDFSSVFKAAQTLSCEMQLDKLIAKLMQILIENTGANKCILLLQESDNWYIQGIATNQATLSILENLPIISNSELPITVINYVKNSLQVLFIDDILKSHNFAADLYLLQQKPKSLLCTPIIAQGKLIGVVYLENNLVSGVFTSDRLQVINLLCSQAAISLENSRLYQQTQNSLDTLKQIQLQLIQSEKMSALGNLVAGVAHEINNPVGFIAGNIQPAMNFVQDLLHLVDLYQQKYPNPDEEIVEEIENIDLDYVRTDLPKLISSMKLGVDRIKGISNSLRTFSRADKEYKVAFNIHDGIDSTILILKHRLKATEKYPEIQVIKEYGEIPDIDCFPGQLNQVFMNLLANAIDALEESNSKYDFDEINIKLNKIIIKTNLSDDGQSVVIAIRDNGVGMSESVKSKIFEHLYTTKPVGKGTGLGLSIAHQIVEKHGGTIAVNSAPGEGTEFLIALPSKIAQ